MKVKNNWNNVQPWDFSCLWSGLKVDIGNSSPYMMTREYIEPKSVGVKNLY